MIADFAAEGTGAAFDQEEAGPAALFVVIAKTGRSGSHLLGRLLFRMGFGVPWEYYHRPFLPEFARRWRIDSDHPAFPQRYLDAILRYRTRNGVCVVDCSPRTFCKLKAGWAARGEPSRLAFIHLWRRDSLAQAISRRLAHQSGYWDLTSQTTSPPKPDLDMWDMAALRETRSWILRQELFLRADLPRHGRPIVHVAYEDLVAEREATLRRIFHELAPDRAAESLPIPNEPNIPDRLWAHQSLDGEARRALYRTYVETFGPIVPLPDP